MKLIVKILTLPIVLTIDVFTWICIGLISCSSLIFGFASFLLTILGITVLATYSWQNGLILLFLAYLASPMGLPMFAVKLLRVAGAYPIVAVDPVAEKREKALTYGADYAFDPTDPVKYDYALFGVGINKAFGQ